MGKYIITKISTKQATDAGMALVLILLLLGFFLKNNLFYIIAIPALVINMTVPRAFYPFAICWFSLSGILGNIMSKVILSVVYFIFVVPVALVRRLMGKDTLQLKDFKAGKESVFKTRNITFVTKDIENPY